MRRGKDWWYILSAEERSTLHHLERCNSGWAQTHCQEYRDREGACLYCDTPIEGMGLCPRCLELKEHLIQKATEGLQHGREYCDMPIEKQEHLIQKVTEELTTWPRSGGSD